MVTGTEHAVRAMIGLGGGPTVTRRICLSLDSDIIMVTVQPEPTQWRWHGDSFRGCDFFTLAITDLEIVSSDFTEPSDSRDLFGVIIAL